MVDSAKVEPRVVGEGEEQRGWGKEGRTGIMAEIKVKKSKEAADRRPSGLKTSLCVVSLPISVVQRERERERERESVCVCRAGRVGCSRQEGKSRCARTHEKGALLLFSSRRCCGVALDETKVHHRRQKSCFRFAKGGEVESAAWCIELKFGWVECLQARRWRQQKKLFFFRKQGWKAESPGR